MKKRLREDWLLIGCGDVVKGFEEDGGVGLVVEKRVLIVAVTAEQ